MIQVYSKKEHCYGCTACEHICPCNAISMEPDEQGFLYPVIDGLKCIDCKKCEKYCVYTNVVKKKEQQTAYAARRMDLKKRMESRSGGIFASVSEKFLQQGYSIYGAAFDENLKVKHIRIEDEKGLQLLKGSKYTQSDLSNTFVMVRDDLQKGQPVLFSGTPCQVGGLLGYLDATNVDTKLLTTADVVCHGVPSPMFYSDFVKLYEKLKGGKIIKFDFRPKNKDCSWQSHLQAYYLEDSPSKPNYTNVYTKIFYDHFCLRPSCFKCNYTSCERVGDFTLADFWGVEKVFPDLFDGTGVSGIVVNSQKGSDALSNLVDIEKRECTIPQIAERQPSMNETHSAPPLYHDFWKDYIELGSAKTIRKYGGYTLTNRIGAKLKRMRSKYLKK